jgi:multidrug resistance efflux pump
VQVWKAAVAKAEAAQRAAEQTIDALEARLQSYEEVSTFSQRDLPSTIHQEISQTKRRNYHGELSPFS